MSEVRLSVPKELRKWHRREQVKLHEVSDRLVAFLHPSGDLLIYPQHGYNHMVRVPADTYDSRQGQLRRLYEQGTKVPTVA